MVAASSQKLRQLKSMDPARRSQETSSNLSKINKHFWRTSRPRRTYYASKKSKTNCPKADKL